MKYSNLCDCILYFSTKSSELLTQSEVSQCKRRLSLQCHELLYCHDVESPIPVHSQRHLCLGVTTKSKINISDLVLPRRHPTPLTFPATQLKSQGYAGRSLWSHLHFLALHFGRHVCDQPGGFGPNPPGQLNLPFGGFQRAPDGVPVPCSAGRHAKPVGQSVLWIPLSISPYETGEVDPTP